MHTRIQQLLTRPQFPEREFIYNGTTFAEVYTMAASLKTLLERAEYKGADICLATENKALIAAALLAATACGQTLLLPFALSDRVLDRLHKTTRFTTAVSEMTRNLPQGVNVLYPEDKGSVQSLGCSQVVPDRKLLKIYTGGSTGSPQVWSKTAANIFEEGFLLARHFGMSSEDSILATIPPYHIYGLLFSVVLPLVASATVIETTPSFPGEIIEVLQQQQATILVSVPAHYHALRQQNPIVSNLRQAFSSAGMLDAGDNETFCDCYQAGITELYGSTETGGIASRNRSKGEEYFTPLPTIRWKVIEERLAVHSPLISPELPLNQEGLFITGDRVEPRGSDSFYLKGRVDGVTKVGGKRVDLEEIRALILKIEAVTDCVVMALTDNGGSEHRIGALVSGGSITIKDIKSTLSQSLEPYAIPRRMKTIDSLPILPNGKYDRVAIIQILER